MSPVPRIDAARVIGDLRELQSRTSDERGAQRVCWGPVWHDARAFLRELLDEIGSEAETDAAGNLWARLGSPDEPALALGSHLDSVPDGGWLDGALGVMAGLGVLRAWADAEVDPPRPLALVDWADEEGARFGRSLLGSSAFSGSLDADAVGALRDSDGVTLADALAENGVDLEHAVDAGRRREDLFAYLELHIEQGPRMESEGLRAAAVTGCVGIERLCFPFRGQASHAGTTPMDMRRDAGLAAAACALAIADLPEREGGVATTGSIQLQPGIATAVAGEAALTVDLRHSDPVRLQALLAGAREAAERCASERDCSVSEEPIWRIAPIPFDAGLAGLARDSCERIAGHPAELESGALHDAAEVARVLPAAMLFAPSMGGISHAPQEDTGEAALALAIDTYGDWVERVLAR